MEMLLTILCNEIIKMFKVTMLVQRYQKNFSMIILNGIFASTSIICEWGLHMQISDKKSVQLSLYLVTCDL